MRVAAALHRCHADAGIDVDQNVDQNVDLNADVDEARVPTGGAQKSGKQSRSSARISSVMKSTNARMREGMCWRLK